MAWIAYAKQTGEEGDTLTRSFQKVVTPSGRTVFFTALHTDTTQRFKRPEENQEFSSFDDVLKVLAGGLPQSHQPPSTNSGMPQEAGNGKRSSTEERVHYVKSRLEMQPHSSAI